MLKRLFDQGCRDAFAYFKAANLATMNPTKPPSNTMAAGSAQNAALHPPASASPPIAADATKSKVLG